MSVVGLDFGNANNVVALARRKGIDVVLNTESKRETPSMVNFGVKQVRAPASRSTTVRSRIVASAFQGLRPPSRDDARVSARGDRNARGRSGVPDSVCRIKRCCRRLCNI